MLKKVIAGGTNDFVQNDITEFQVREWLRQYIPIQWLEDLREKNDWGRTPMSIACEYDRLDIAQWLVDYGAKGDVSKGEGGSWTPMSYACRAGHLRVAQWLVDHGAKGDVSKGEGSGCTPMHLACWKGHLEVAQWLFDNGAAENISKADNDGKTPMHWACWAGHLRVVQWLYSVGSEEDIRKADSDCDTPMLIACIKGHLDVAHWLVLNGALNTPKETGAGAANAATNDTGQVDSSLVKELVKQLKLLGKEPLLRTLLAWAQNLREHPGFKMMLMGTLNMPTGNRKGSPQLWKLNGHGGLYKRLVASFVGFSHFSNELSENNHPNIKQFADALETILEADEGGDGSADTDSENDTDTSSADDDSETATDAGSAAGGGTPNPWCTLS